jgi:tetratricopeptide (TPR) repeat protein
VSEPLVLERETPRRRWLFMWLMATLCYGALGIGCCAPIAYVDALPLLGHTCAGTSLLMLLAALPLALQLGREPWQRAYVLDDEGVRDASGSILAAWRDVVDADLDRVEARPVDLCQERLTLRDGRYVSLDTTMLRLRAGAEGVHAMILARLQPRSALATLRDQGRTLLRAGDVAAATARFTQALTLEPSDVDALCGRARARRLTGDAAGARADLDEALRLGPDHAPSWRERAELRLEDDPHGALDDVTRSLELRPDDDRAWTVRAFARDRLGLRGLMERQGGIDRDYLQGLK